MPRVRAAPQQRRDQRGVAAVQGHKERREGEHVLGLAVQTGRVQQRRAGGQEEVQRRRAVVLEGEHEGVGAPHADLPRPLIELGHAELVVDGVVRVQDEAIEHLPGRGAPADRRRE